MYEKKYPGLNDFTDGNLYTWTILFQGEVSLNFPEGQTPKDKGLDRYAKKPEIKVKEHHSSNFDTFCPNK